MALGRAWTGSEVTMRIHGLNVRVTTRKGRQLNRSFAPGGEVEDAHIRFRDDPPVQARDVP